MLDLRFVDLDFSLVTRFISVCIAHRVSSGGLSGSMGYMLTKGKTKQVQNV